MTINNNEKNEANVEQVTEGQTVSVHYSGTLEDGTKFDSSYDRGAPISFTTGSGQMIEGFEKNILGMKLGEKKKFVIEPAQAYGDHNPEAVQEIDKGNFPPDFDFVVGTMVQGSSPTGTPVVGKITAASAQAVTLDFNHPMAGKTLTFEVEVMSLDQSS